MEKSFPLPTKMPHQKAQPLSREFLLSRGQCCFSGCQNCPYSSLNDLQNPDIPRELQLAELDQDSQEFHTDFYDFQDEDNNENNTEDY